MLDLLAERHDVLAVDLPGFGETPMDLGFPAGPAGFAPGSPTSFKDLGIVDPHVVGNSMGGGIALELGRKGVASRVTAFSPIGFWRVPGRIWCQGSSPPSRVGTAPHPCCRGSPPSRREGSTRRDPDGSSVARVQRTSVLLHAQG